MTDDTPAPSPLAEAAPDSLDTLFERFDSHIAARTLTLPNALKDRAAIVAELRRQREAWERAEAAGAKRMPKPKRVDPSATTLDDLGLANGK